MSRPPLPSITPASVRDPVDLDQGFDDGAVGVYLHLPFCERVCPYCDFAVIAARSLEPERESRYVEALLRELEARQGDFEGRALASLYLGGGTPSLFRASSIERLVSAVGTAFPGGVAGVSPEASGRDSEPIADVLPALEITLELNPSTLEADRLPGFRAAGVNRLSIGIQSFDDEQLKRLGRAHRAARAEQTLEAARAAGFDNISLDLIFAGPGQTEAALDRDLDRVIEFGPEHVSTYELTFEPETPFGRALAGGKMAACDEDRAADMIEQIEARLTGAGFERYEISSYARPGYRARHNARYWNRQAVLGLGMGAHSFEARTPGAPHGARRANPRFLETWEAALEADPGRAGEEEALPVETARGEAVFLGLRQKEGLDALRFEAEFGGPPRRWFAPQIEALIARGWLEEGGARAGTHPGDLRLTPDGRLVADSVASEFLATEASAD